MTVSTEPCHGTDCMSAGNVFAGGRRGVVFARTALRSEAGGGHSLSSEAMGGCKSQRRVTNHVSCSTRTDDYANTAALSAVPDRRRDSHGGRERDASAESDGSAESICCISFFLFNSVWSGLQLASSGRRRHACTEAMALGGECGHWQRTTLHSTARRARCSE